MKISNQKAQVIIDAFKTLEINPTNDVQYIKQSWKKLAVLCHPDKCTDDAAKKVAEERFKQLLAAREIATGAASELVPIDKILEDARSCDNTTDYDHDSWKNFDNADSNHDSEWKSFSNSPDDYFESIFVSAAAAVATGVCAVAKVGGWVAGFCFSIALKIISFIFGVVAFICFNYDSYAPAFAFGFIAIALLVFSEKIFNALFVQ